jgi:mRNA-degrading endonuclease toxin of MazEF toxin-antitoxin module
MEIIPEIIKIIDWCGIKVQLQASNITLFPYRKEIWWASLGQNIGVEINGKNNRYERPVLVIKVFNSDSLLIAPITSNVNKKVYAFPFTNLDRETNYVRISQMRTISSKRLIRKVGEMSDTEFENILEFVIESIFKTKAPFGAISESLRRGPNTDILSK